MSRFETYGFNSCVGLATCRAVGLAKAEARQRSTGLLAPAPCTYTLPGYPILRMAHIIQNKKKLLARVSRIRGQINGIERALEENHDCGEVLLTLAACRGALNALMAEILEGHVRQHVLNEKSTKSQVATGDELIEVIERYLK